MRNYILFLALAYFGNCILHAQVKTIAHFKMGQGTAVTYATGAERITAQNNKDLVLEREGNPVFFASAPEGKDGGSILFTGDNGYYHSDGAFAHADDNFVFEVFAKARISDKNDLDAKHTSGVAGVGDGKKGYNIVQIADKWFAMVPEIGTFELGVVTFNTWAHIGLVADGNLCTLWLNGEKKGSFRRSPEVNTGFIVGNLGRGNNQFNGEIYEVRYATFKKGTFRSSKDFLLNYNLVSEKKKTKAQIGRI